MDALYRVYAAAITSIFGSWRRGDVITERQAEDIGEDQIQAWLESGDIRELDDVRPGEVPPQSGRQNQHTAPAPPPPPPTPPKTRPSTGPNTANGTGPKGKGKGRGTRKGAGTKDDSAKGATDGTGEGSTADGGNDATDG